MLFETTMRKNHISSGIQTQFTSTIYIFVMKHFRRVLHVWIFFLLFCFFLFFHFVFASIDEMENIMVLLKEKIAFLYFTCARNRNRIPVMRAKYENKEPQNVITKMLFTKKKKIPKKTSNDLFPNQDKLSISAMKFVDSNEIYICFFFKMAFCFHN